MSDNRNLTRERKDAILEIKDSLTQDATIADADQGDQHYRGDAHLRDLVLGGDDPRDRALEERPISEQTIFKGLIFDVSRVDVVLPNKDHAKRDVVRHPGAVAVIALTEDGRICVVRQYRVSLDRVTVEIPAGKLAPGEDPLIAAGRELAEETGIQAGKLAYLTSIASSVGFTDEIIHIYMATELTFLDSSPDEDEFLGVDLIQVTELVDAVLDGKIEDGKTVVGALICDAVLRRLEADTAEHTEQ